MKVYELMKELSELPSGAEVIVVQELAVENVLQKEQIHMDENVLYRCEAQNMHVESDFDGRVYIYAGSDTE